MNIDYLANLVESADVSTFRTLATLFLRSIGYSRGFFSDGPYDGGIDFFVLHDKENGVQTAFQLSVEARWRLKLENELKKAKTNYPEIKTFVFVSKRRIPLHSIRKLNTTFIQRFGIAATHYDNQAIATEFIDKNLVGKLYEALGISAPPSPPKALVTPKTEAASALLLFGAESQDFRAEMTESLLLAELHKVEPTAQADLLSGVIVAHTFSEAQRSDLMRALQRALQHGRVISRDSLLALSPEVRSKLDGLNALAGGEFDALRRSVEVFLRRLASTDAAVPTDKVLEDILELSVGLWRRFAPHPSKLQST